MPKMTVNNAKEKVLNKNSFNDEDIMQDVLGNIKYLSTLYGTFNQEASNKELLSKLEPISKKVSDLARDTFNLMFEKGWYSLEAIDKNKIKTEHTKFLAREPEL